MATSTAQAIATVPVWDYLMAPGDPMSTNPKGLSGRRVKISLTYGLSQSASPVTLLDTEPVGVTTDGNGFWQVNLVPNNKISPAGTLYTVEIEGYRSYVIRVTDVGAPAIGWQSSAIAVLPPIAGGAGYTLPDGTTVNGTLLITSLGAGLVPYADTGGLLVTDSTLAFNKTTKVLATNALSVAGLAGATQAGRWAGATPFGAPTSGTFGVGDWVISRATGNVFICTAAGTPGTWTSANGIFNVVDYGADPTGTNDSTTAIQSTTTAALTIAGSTVYFPAGTYKITATVNVSSGNGGVEFLGTGLATRIQAFAPFTGSTIFNVTKNNCAFRKLDFQPGTSTLYSSNPACDQVTFNGSNNNYFEDITGYYWNGWLVNTIPNGTTNPLGNFFDNIAGTQGKQGFHFQGQSVGSYSVAANVSNVFLSHMLAGDGIFCDSAHDVLASNFAAVLDGGASAFSCVHVNDNCAGVYFLNADCGGIAGGAYTGISYKVEHGASTRANNVMFIGGVTSNQGTGMSIDCDDFLMQGHTFLQSQNDGIDVIGAGQNIVITNTYVRQSNLSAGTGYDVKITNTNVVTLREVYGESTGTSVTANLFAQVNTRTISCTWSATTQVTNASPINLGFNAGNSWLLNVPAGQGYFFALAGNNIVDFFAAGNGVRVFQQLYPGDQAGALQNSGGFLHATAVPSNANGNNNDWAISDNGRLYFKVAGAWVTPSATLKKGSGGGNYVSASTSYVDVDATNLALTITIPTNWKLVVHASGQLTSATAVATVSVSLLDGSTLVEAQVNPTVAGTAGAEDWALNWVINGDAASHTVKLQYKTSNGADSATMLNSSATLVPTMTFVLMPSS